MNYKLLILDVDGTLTNGKIYMSENGELFKAFHVKDGFGIKLAIKQGIIPIIITGRVSKIVERRVKELGNIELYQGIENKLEFLDEVIKSKNVKYIETVYIGDDLNDLDAMNKCGFTACPFNATQEVKDVCDYVSPYFGGDGAVRDCIEFILKGR